MGIPQLKRRWLRLSLRTLLSVVTVACLWLGWNVRVSQQREAVEWVTARGGTIRYDFEIDGNGRFIGNNKQPGPDWIRNRIGIDHLATVVSVRWSPKAPGQLSDNLAHTQVNNLSPLNQLRSLRYLNLSCTKIIDVTQLCDLPRLKHLDLYNTQVSDVALLGDLTSLNYLNLSCTTVSDISPLDDLTRLNHLGLYRTQVSDVTPLADLRNLNVLDLSVTRVSDVGTLGSLTSLTRLNR